MSGLQSADLWAIVTAGSILLITALLAEYVPARRASRTGPMVSLRAK